MVRHIEFTINFDLTCWGEPEDFETDDPINIKESIEDWVCNESDSFLDHLKLNKVWYEEDE